VSARRDFSDGKHAHCQAAANALAASSQHSVGALQLPLPVDNTSTQEICSAAAGTSTTVGNSLMLALQMLPLSPTRQLLQAQEQIPSLLTVSPAVPR